MLLPLIGLLLLAILLANAWATRAVLIDDLSTPAQRAAQLAFIWLVPLLGALLTLHFLRKDDEPSEGRYREIPDPGGDMVSSAFGPWVGREGPNSDVSGPSDAGSSD